MKKWSIITRIKMFIAGIGWKLFIWGNNLTEEEYWHSIYLQESSLQWKNQESGINGLEY